MSLATPDTISSTDLEELLNEEVACAVYTDCGQPAVMRCLLHHADGKLCSALPSCTACRTRLTGLLRDIVAGGGFPVCKFHELPVGITWTGL